MNFLDNISFEPPVDWIQISCIDMHTGGEPLRIPIKGLPEIKGLSVLEKRRFFKKHYDHLRKGLIFEPRGHADMYGAIISEPSTDDAHFDVFFIHNEGYSTMCGHAIIALTKFAFETGLVGKRNQGKLIINVPAGKIHAEAIFSNNEVLEASFLNVPSYLYLENKLIEIEELGQIKVDVAFGGAFYAIVEADTIGLELADNNYYKLIDWGRKIKYAVQEKFDITHPTEPDLSFLYGTIFTGPARNQKNHSQNVCIFAEGEVDRSATGSGVSARAALHFTKGELKLNQPITIESILESTMSVEVISEKKYHGYKAVIPKVSGSAYFTGAPTYYFDPNDPWKQGFILR